MTAKTTMMMYMRMLSCRAFLFGSHPVRRAGRQRDHSVEASSAPIKYDKNPLERHPAKAIP